MYFIFLIAVIILIFKIFNIEKRIQHLEEKLLPSNNKKQIEDESESETFLKVRESNVEQIVSEKNIISKTDEKLTQSEKSIESFSLIKKTEDGITFFGQKLIVWIAGFSAILGAFYLVQYSIERGLLSPIIRLVLACIFALSSTISGYLLYNKKSFANNERIAQALMGAGISAFYFVAYALSKIYNFVPENVSFILMCLVTILSVFLTLKRGGKPIAILSLIGGFLTPTLVGGISNSVVLFSSYLFVLSFAFLIIASKLDSILLLILNLLGLYILTCVWIFLGCHTFDSFWLMTTLTIITFAAIILCPKYNNSLLDKFFKYGVFGICFIFAFVFLFKTNFGMLEWAIIGVLLLAMLFLTFKDLKSYFPIFISAIAFSFLTLFSQQMNNDNVKNIIFIGLAIIGLLPFYLAIWVNKKQEFLSYIVIAAPIIYGLNYILFKNETILPYVGLLSGVLLILPSLTFNYKEELEQKNAGLLVLSCFTLFTLSFASLVQTDFWPIVLSVEILLLGVIMTFFKVKYLNFGIAALFSAFIIAQLYNIVFILGILLFGQIISSRFDVLYLTNSFYISYIIIPIISFVTLAFISKDKTIKLISIATSTIIGIFGLFSFYMLMKMKFLNINLLSPNFGEQGFITNILLLSFAGLLYFKKNIFDFLFKLGLWRLITISLIFASPFFSNMQTSVINLCFVYGTPVVLFSWYAFLSKDDVKGNFSKLSAFFSFVLVSSLLTQALYGTVNIGEINFTDFGIFLYSILWLSLGAIWLLVAFRNKFLVKPAFGLIYFVIAKVFLFDVSSSDGIWRICALFVLAGSLLGISHFYTKYFKN